jgi:acetyl-CoA carboxylase carboxyltransferase component
VIPKQENQLFDIRKVIERIVDAGSGFEIKKRFAGEIITSLARLDGAVVGILANQPKVKGGVLMVDSADKAARFIWLCDAFGIPLLYLADVPGFMIGKQVERQGIIRAGAKMIMAMSQASVPRISVILRKAYGAGLYAMCGPGFDPDACIALPSAMIAVMGAEAAVNAVHYNRIQALPEAERESEVERLRAEYRSDVDIERLASELVVDAVVAPARLREEIAGRLAAAASRRDPPPNKRRSIPPM